MRLLWFKPTIGKRLKEEGFKPLHRKNSKYWVELAKSYVEQQYRPKFIRAGLGNTNEEIARKLHDKTRRVLGRPFEEELFTKAKQWCVVPIVIEARAKKLGFSFLDNDPLSHRDDELWRLRIEDYRPERGEMDFSYYLDKENTIEGKTREIKRLSREYLAKRNHEQNAELYWNSAIRWFTKNRP